MRPNFVNALKMNKQEIVVTPLQVNVKLFRDLEAALRRLRKKVERERLFERLMQCSYYEKPSVRRRRKMKLAQWRRQKTGNNTGGR